MFGLKEIVLNKTTKQNVSYEKRNRIAYVTIRRAEELKSFRYELIEQMADVWERFKYDDEAWVAILTTEGDHFFLNGEHNKGELQHASDVQNIIKICPSFQEIWKPVIAAIQGYCIGEGWMLAQECDFRIAADTTIFGLPEGKCNIIPSLVGMLWRHLPPCLALELLLTGDFITAQRAYEIGFLNRIGSKEVIMDISNELAENICSAGPISVKRMKELYYMGYSMDRDEVLEHTWEYFDETLKQRDTAEGLKAFSEKRKPNYQGF
jgi:enoyl-CoA hydratase